ncbi:hypothetical protein ET495_17335 (plasmid) [Xylanimonas allomyrinae]|uniref:4Fe-4S ferredoxin-type domain-containing protein n=1 Tax=Xylanimonas allomyrinae TaxID=2509459 RepID=A0A4P6EQ87_9MICO|nr:hypothetical protein [Xylanimonas allomyrinae]QAY64984.1 hypothetical protein ET495_17335 [Xylanimonas allomyrinae]
MNSRTVTTYFPQVDHSAARPRAVETSKPWAPVGVVGPTTGHTWTALDTGERWNGCPVIAFTYSVMRAIIAAGDGADVDGGGLTTDPRGRIIDTTGADVEAVPSLTVSIENRTTVVYIPAGRCWDTVTLPDYDEHDRCRHCGAHLAEPCSPGCPAPALEPPQ